MILRPGQGGREPPGDVVLEAGVGVGRVGRHHWSLQLVAHHHVRHGGPAGDDQLLSLQEADVNVKSLISLQVVSVCSDGLMF